MKLANIFSHPLCFVFMTLGLTIYGQFIIKWQVSHMGAFPSRLSSTALYLFHLLLNPWVISGLFGAFLASLSWMLAMSKLPLSYAYPFMSLAFPLTIILSSFIFHEVITFPKIIGCVLIMVGVYVLSHG